MNDKTEELRDIFLDVTDEETVTESQEELRGSVAGSEGSGERLGDVIGEMHEKFAFETALSTEQLERLVRLFYDDYDDEEVGEELSISPETVFRARMDLHLVRNDDPPGATVDEETWETARTQPDADAAALAEQTGLDGDTAERVRAVIAANNRSRRVSHRFRTAFEESVTDAELTEQFAAETDRDGLDDATEDAEVDVDF